MSTCSRAASHAGAALGAVGLLVAIGYAIAYPGPGGILGGLGWLAGGVAPLYLVGVWLARKRPDHPQVRRMLVMGSALAVNIGMEGPTQHAVRQFGAGEWLWWVNLIYAYTAVVTLIAGALMLASYPDGVVERPWQRRVLQSVWLHLALPPLLLLTNKTLVIHNYLLDPPPVIASPFFVSWLGFLGGPVRSIYLNYLGGLIVIAVLFFRFVQADRQQRARMRLLVYVAAALSVVTFFVVLFSGQYGANAPVWYRLLGVLSVVLLLMVPVSVVVGILRHRLFEIDVVVRRSMVYGLLLLIIAIVYIGLAVAPGLALGGRIPVELAVLLTIVAAAAFQPLRRRLEAVADRMVFGERVNRYQVLTTFGARLEQTVDLQDLVPQLAETVHRGLDAGWVRVSLPGTSAVAGEPSGDPALVVPLERGGEIIGRIECGAKDGGYRPGDYELLATLAGQAATAIANVQLTARLGERVAELARSRARIVSAEDSERRRIERNIHDGAQQQVVALIMKLRLARNQLDRGERALTEVFDELQSDARELLADLRELAHGIHPPVLSDRGLVAAVEARADRLPLDITVYADGFLREQRLDSDVEGAAYYVICEALTNIVKHAGASTAGIRLSTADGQLSVLVQDNGVGLGSSGRTGHGLTNLRDRVEALGGTITVNGPPGTGTTLHARLPVGASSD